MANDSITLIFPHQLFRKHPALHSGRPVCLVEESLFFRELPFHKKKLQLHRASMKSYEAFLSAQYHVQYIDATDDKSDVRLLIAALTVKGILELHLADPVDDWLLRRIKSSVGPGKIKLEIYPSPAFLNSREDLAAYSPETGRPRNGRVNQYFLADFYKDQRRKNNVLVDDKGKPEGGKWSYDAENRKRLPASQRPPFVRFPPENEFVTEAARYIEQNFADNPGELSPMPGGGFYPVNFQEADDWLQTFLDERFAAFGPYQDAMRANEHFMFHSILTPMLNTGLLEPETVIGKALKTAERKQIPLPSLEGFLRQVMGWREFIRAVYEKEGRRQRTSHSFGFTRKIPDLFRKGNTGVLPVDIVMRKVLQTGYAHHIERLMILGNFMLLCEFNPDEVYRFFMEFFIDAYDWVMVPNVYGMSQFADGGLMSTKPYISASHYLTALGDWKKGGWEIIWDSLFWRFLHVHRELFSKNPRSKMLLGRWDGMDAAKQNELLKAAAGYLEKLDNDLADEPQRGKKAGELF